MNNLRTRSTESQDIGILARIEAFIRRNFDINAEDYIAESSRIHEAVLKKFGKTTSRYNKLFVVTTARRKLFLSGRSKLISKLYLPLVLAFGEGAKGKITENMMLDWYLIARENLGFKSATVEKIRNSYSQLLALGYFSNFNDEQANLSIEKLNQKLSRRHDIVYSTYWGSNSRILKKTIAEILLTNPEFSNWPEKVDFTKLVAALKEKGITNIERTAVSNTYYAIRKEVRSAP